MARRTATEVESDAVDALIAALESLDLSAAMPSVDVSERGLVAEVAGRRFGVEVKPVVTAALGERLARGWRRHRLPRLIVADRIAADAKRSLRDAEVNYFDRRGELRIVDPPLVIDAIVESLGASAARARGPLDSQVAKETAIACLRTPDQPHGVREVARYIDRAPSAVSKAMAGLRDEGLLTSRGEAMVPDLFHELLAVWRRRAISLAALPDPSARSAMRLGLGIDHPEATVGWALTDTLAAASWGIPIVARGDHPPDFYVPSDSQLRAARSVLGDASSPRARACTVAVAPVRLACLRRIDHSPTTGERWPVANHIIVALDIAQDRARGLEALDQWQPESIVRAW